jgi:hypothetical protein
VTAQALEDRHEIPTLSKTFQGSRVCTLTTPDGQAFNSKLEKIGGEWFVHLEGDCFAARVPLSPFIAHLLAAKASKEVKA